MEGPDAANNGILHPDETPPNGRWKAEAGLSPPPGRVTKTPISHAMSRVVEAGERGVREARAVPRPEFAEVVTLTYAVICTV